MNRLKRLPILILLISFVIGCQKIPLETIQANIEKRSLGLSFVSEDNPVQSFSFPGRIDSLDGYGFCSQAGLPEYGIHVYEIPYDRFFAPLMEKDDRWRILRNYMISNLDQIKVYQVTGNIKSKIYVAGLYQNRIIGIVVSIE